MVFQINCTTERFQLSTGRKAKAACALLACAMLLLLAILYVHRYKAANDRTDNAERYFVNSYKCVNSTCVVTKFESTEKENSGIDGSVDVCHLNCGRYGPLWPKPTVETAIGKSIVEFGIDNIKFDTSQMADQQSQEYMVEASQVFTSSLKKLCIPNCIAHTTTPLISVTTSSLFDYIKLTTDESYNLKITTEDDRVVVKIEAKTVYGARHGLETLRQLIASYGSSKTGKKLVMATDVQISDRPAYAYRGYMLDTARHYFPLSTIRRHIDAMGHSKLNVFHWHATDSHSFPLDLPSSPNMSKYGAYSAEERYLYYEIKDLFRYALVRGVRIIMEIDSPAHSDNGWQWGKAAGYGDMVLCVDKGPWRKSCQHPSCGQLNPINTHTYKWLGKIYKDLISLFPKGEAFHMGGDEVFLNCWNETPEIIDWMKTNNRSLDINGFKELWAEFHANALSEYDKEAGNSGSDIIVWSSGLTLPGIIEKYLDKKRYTVEVWEGPAVSAKLVKLGYKVIFALKDIYYLDHGFWIGSHYHNWKTIYNYTLPEVSNPELLLGGEACMWSEFVDENGIDSRVWPRVAALAERLWTNPSTHALDAQYRLLQHRRRLVTLGIKADAIMPEWCYHHDGECLFN